MNHLLSGSTSHGCTAHGARGVNAKCMSRLVGWRAGWHVWAAAGCLLAGLLTGCTSSKSAQSTASDGHGPKGQPAASAKVATPAPLGPVVEDASFELRAETKPQYGRGAESSLSIVLTPKGAFHVNEEYPIRVRLTAPPVVGLVKAALEKNDATEFSKQRARFDVPFVATQAGSSKVRAVVSFAVCTDENCIPDERTLEFTVAVQ
jgi:hypothetical protein